MRHYGPDHLPQVCAYGAWMLDNTLRIHPHPRGACLPGGVASRRVHHVHFVLVIGIARGGKRAPTPRPQHDTRVVQLCNVLAKRDGLPER